MEVVIGAGLAQFVPDVGAAMVPYAPHRHKVLTIVADKASSNLSLFHWLQWKTQLRMVHMRDPLHREWNDVTDALKKAGLWSVVLLTTVVFNLAYGPWKGSAWWRKLQEGGAELAATAGVGDQLLEEFYEPICQDLGVEAFGDAEHKAEILEFATAGQLQARRGERVTLRRWFSWMVAAQDHDQVWHARLLVITSIGLRLGLWTEARQHPFFRGRDIEHTGERCAPDVCSKVLFQMCFPEVCVPDLCLLMCIPYMVPALCLLIWALQKVIPDAWYPRLVADEHPRCSTPFCIPKVCPDLFRSVPNMCICICVSPSDSTQQCFGCLSPMYSRPGFNSCLDVCRIWAAGLYRNLQNVIWYGMPHVLLYHSQLCFLERAIKEN